MLKKFFWNLLSSFVGTWIALLGFGVLVLIVIIGLVARIGISSSVSSAKVEKHSILRIDLSGTIDERETNADLDYMTLMRGNVERRQSLATLVTALEEAKENKNIDAVYIECGGVSAGFATLDALRKAIVDFKTSGKKVYAYADSYMAGDYFVASCADSVFLNPDGSMALQGIYGAIPYFKNLFDKLGIQFQVAKVGTFKSAVEPYIMSEMSQPARAQLDTLYGNIWNYIKSEIAESRKIKVADIDKLVDTDLITFAPVGLSVKGKLVDKLVYGRTVKEILGRLVGKDPEKLNFITPSVLTGQTDWGSAYSDDNQVAVLYATGDIAETANAGINCFKLVPEIVKLADDDNVKALVLRVNSPGGSVFGSAQIAEALQYFKSKKKTFVVSMGDYAASGGYWISADAERIFADPLTVTGSIGIFGMFPNISGALDKIGVNMQMVATDPQAAFPTFVKPVDERQMASLQSYINRGYDRFIKRVAKGRRMSEAKVRTIAEGRVWDAVTAKEIGLVDELGGMRDAIRWAAKKSGLGENYDVALYPKYEPGFWDFLPDASNASLMEAVASAMNPALDPAYSRHAVEVLTRKPVQARMIPIDLAKCN